MIKFLHRPMAFVVVMTGLGSAAALADECAYDYQCETQLRSCEGSSYDSGCRESFSSCVTTCRNASGSSTSAAPGPSAPAQFGAIAYSPSSRAYGYSFNFGDRSSAESIALGRCRQNAGGATDCDVKVWFQACGALASASDGSFGTGWGGNPAAANSEAVRVCSAYSAGCQVQGTVCNGPD